MSKVTIESIKMVEEFHNMGLSDKEIGLAMDRSEKSVGQILHHYRDKMDLIDRKIAKQIRRYHEKSTTDRVMQATKVKSKPRKRKLEPKKSVWDRMIGFFG